MDIDDYDDDEDVVASSSTQPPKTVPDDVHLPCNDHLHWECLLDSSDYSACPACSQSILSTPPSSSQPQQQRQQQDERRIIVTLHNEGGVQEALDIFPLLKEESYLRAHPHERKCRAFLEFAREGDYHAIADVLKSCGESPDSDDDDDIDGDDQVNNTHPPLTADALLRYQDPLNSNESALHAAVANGHREVAWLLLLLASTYPELEVPALVFQEAAALGVMREEQAGLVDIRSLRDAGGRSAEDVARQSGMVWTGWVGNGRLAMPGGGGAEGGGGGGAVTV